MKRVLVIGGGSIGERHVRCFLNTGRVSVSLCEINDAVRERVAQTYSLPDSFATLAEAIRQTFDAAVICTPAHLHLSMAQDLIAQGLPILIEKPLSIATTGVAELKAALQSHSLPSSVAYVYRQHPALQSMRSALLAGRFGRPLQLVMVGGQHFPFYRPAYRETYYTDHATGGGAIQDALTHMINAAEWLVGPTTRLVADAQHLALEGVSVEDTVHLITRHRNPIGEVMGSFSLNQHQAANETVLTVIGERGVARFEAHRARWLSCAEPGADWTVEAEFALERDDLFIRQANAFLDQVEDGAPAACSIEDAEQTLRVGLATLESASSGQWVQV